MHMTQEKGATNGQRKTAIIAEDEEIIRLDLEEALQEEGYTVLRSVNNGEDAVKYAREDHPDVVILDVRMPKLDGISAARIISKEGIAPVVILTAFSQEETVESVVEAGAGAYVVKPFEPKALFPAIEIAIARFKQLSILADEVTDLKHRFLVRKKVDRAKAMLMNHMGLSEAEAFRWIQKNSMDRRLTMEEVADAVISQLEDEEREK